MQEALAARLEQATAAVAAAKQRLAASQTERKTIETEVAAIQTRLSKYKGQLLELKTNKEYTTMLHEIAIAEEAIRSHEDRVLERMEEAETITGEVKAAEAELKTQQAAIAAERKALDAEATALQGTADETVRGARRGGQGAVARGAQAVRTRVEAAQGARGRRGARRQLHRLPRAHAAADVQRGAPRRDPRSSARAATGFSTSCRERSDPALDHRVHRRRRQGQPRPRGLRRLHPAAPTALSLDELHGGLGIATNNVAEYNGLLAALRWAKEHGHTTVHIKADSLLVVEQMRGRFKVKHPGLQPLHAKATLLAHESAASPSSTSAAS